MRALWVTAVRVAVVRVAVVLVAVFLVAVFLVAGCSEQPTVQSKPVVKVQTDPPQPPPPPPPMESSAPEPADPPDGSRQLEDGKTPSANAGDPNSVRVKAEAGVGVRGQGLNDPRLVQTIVAPARALFRTQQRMVFEVQIPHALQLYEASNGKKPRTHEEFMEQIIQANQIKLPELPSGQRYVYDPQTGELMVEKPAE